MIFRFKIIKIHDCAWSLLYVLILFREEEMLMPKKWIGKRIIIFVILYDIIMY